MTLLYFNWGRWLYCTGFHWGRWHYCTSTGGDDFIVLASTCGDDIIVLAFDWLSNLSKSSFFKCLFPKPRHPYMVQSPIISSRSPCVYDYYYSYTTRAQLYKWDIDCKEPLPVSWSLKLLALMMWERISSSVSTLAIRSSACFLGKMSNWLFQVFRYPPPYTAALRTGEKRAVYIGGILENGGKVSHIYNQVKTY